MCYGYERETSSLCPPAGSQAGVAVGSRTGRRERVPKGIWGRVPMGLWGTSVLGAAWLLFCN